jgi:Raf kinase inhibitor-like YbhB/YbcL family protein
MRRSAMLAVPILPALLLLAACGDGYDGPVQEGPIRVSSPAFAPGKPIPAVHAHGREGKNVAPALAWSGAPPATKEFAVVVEDPDAPMARPFVHWVVYGIAPTASGLPAPGAVEGKNDFGENGWGGPEPPPGSVHHYRFRVLALDAPVSLPPGATLAKLEAATKGHVLADGYVVGTYESP